MPPAVATTASFPEHYLVVTKRPWYKEKVIPPPQLPPALTKLRRLQEANGSFKLSPALRSALGGLVPEPPEGISDVCTPKQTLEFHRSDSLTARFQHYCTHYCTHTHTLHTQWRWATALATVFMLRHPQLHDALNPIYERSREFVDDHLLHTASEALPPGEQ